MAHHDERAYLICSVELATISEKRTYEGSKLPKAMRRYRKALKRDGLGGSVTLRISRMSETPNAQPTGGIAYAVISDTEGQLYLTIPR